MKKEQLDAIVDNLDLVKKVLSKPSACDFVEAYEKVRCVQFIAQLKADYEKLIPEEKKVEKSAQKKRVTKRKAKR